MYYENTQKSEIQRFSKKNRLQQITKHGEKKILKSSQIELIKPEQNNDEKQFNSRSRRAYQDAPFIQIMQQHSMKTLNDKWAKRFAKQKNCGNYQTVTIEGKTLNKYCGLRTCSTCNQIKFQNYMKYCGHMLNSMITNNNTPMYMTTLTVPNVTDEKLQETIHQFQKNVTHYITLYNQQKRRLKQPITFNGITAYEITYNAMRNNYHPHCHIAHQALTDNNNRNDIQTYKPISNEMQFPETAMGFTRTETLKQIKDGKVVENTFTATYGEAGKTIQASNLRYTNTVITNHLKNNPEASILGTDIRTFWDAKEIIKYPIKTINGKGKHNKQVNPEAVINILNAIEGRYITKTYGILNHRGNNRNKNAPNVQDQTNINDESTIVDELQTKSQSTSLAPGEYKRTITKNKVTLYQVSEYTPIVDEETGEPEMKTTVKLNKDGTPKRDKNGEVIINQEIAFVKTPCYKIIHEFIPNKKQLNKWIKIENSNKQ